MRFDECRVSSNSCACVRCAIHSTIIYLRWRNWDEFSIVCYIKWAYTCNSHVHNIKFTSSLQLSFILCAQTFRSFIWNQQYCLVRFLTKEPLVVLPAAILLVQLLLCCCRYNFFFCFTFACCYSYCVWKMEGFLYKKCALDTNDKFGRWFLGHFIVFINFNYFANRMYLYCVSNVWKFQKKTDSWLQRKIYVPVSCYWVKHPLYVDHIGIQKSAV